MATTTAKLGLRKPDPADNVSVATDISDNMQKIDDGFASIVPAYRNKLRNGDFSVAQRGNGPFTSPAFGTTGIDGWKHAAVGTSATSSLTREIPAYSSRLTGNVSRTHLKAVQTGGTSTDAQSIIALQPIEGLPFASGSQITLSFIANVSTNSTIYVELIMDGTYTSTSLPNVVPINLTTGAKSYSITLTMPTYDAAINVADHSTRFVLWSYAGSAVATGHRAPMLGMTRPVGVTYEIAEIQLEPGTVATAFERLPQQVQLAWCQRYYYRMTASANSNTFAVGYSYSTTSGLSYLAFPVTMRAVPAVASTGLTALNGSASGVPVTSLTSTYLKEWGGRLDWATAGGFTLGQGAMLFANAAGNYLDFSAEL